MTWRQWVPEIYPFTAGTTVAYGQNYEDAVKSITLNTAKILKIDDVVGSIEKIRRLHFLCPMETL